MLSAIIVVSARTRYRQHSPSGKRGQIEVHVAPALRTPLAAHGPSGDPFNTTLFFGQELMRLSRVGMVSMPRV
jgi:hypothetical protein